MSLRRKPHSIASPVAGLDTSKDAALITDHSSPNIRNVRFDRGVVRKDLGANVFNANALDGRVMFMDQFDLISGDTRNIFTTLESIYFRSSNGTFNKLNVANLAGNANDYFQATQVLDANGNDQYIITNNVDEIQVWDGNVSGNTANYTGLAANETAQCLASFSSRLVLGNTFEGGLRNPWRIRWSVAGDYTDLANTGSGLYDLYETADAVKALIPFESRLFIFREKSIWELIYVGGSKIFDPVRRIDGIGTFAPNAIAVLENQIVFPGPDDIYAYDGQSLKRLSGSIHPLLFPTETRIMSLDSPSKIVGAYIQELTEYWLSIPTVGSEPDTIFKYNFPGNAWIRREQHATCFGFFKISGGLTWEENTDTWANQTGPWLTRNVPANAPTILLGCANGYILEDDRLTKSNETMIFETKDFMLAAAERVVGFHLEAKDGAFRVDYSLDGGNTWTVRKSFAASNVYTEGFASLNLTAAQIRFRIVSSANDLSIRWIEPCIVERQRSKTLA